MVHVWMSVSCESSFKRWSSAFHLGGWFWATRSSFLLHIPICCGASHRLALTITFDSGRLNRLYLRVTHRVLLPLLISSVASSAPAIQMRHACFRLECNSDMHNLRFLPSTSSKTSIIHSYQTLRSSVCRHILTCTIEFAST